MHCAPSHRVHERSTFPFSSAKSLSLRGSFIHIPNLVCTMRRYTLRCIMCVWVSECVDHSRAYKLNWNWIVVEELKRYGTHAMSIEPKKEKKMDYYKENGTVIRREMWKSYARCVAVEWTARSSKSIDLYSLCFVIVTISFSRTHTHTPYAAWFTIHILCHSNIDNTNNAFRFDDDEQEHSAAHHSPEAMIHPMMESNSLRVFFFFTHIVNRNAHWHRPLPAWAFWILI